LYRIGDHLYTKVSRILLGRPLRYTHTLEGVPSGTAQLSETRRQRKRPRSRVFLIFAEQAFEAFSTDVRKLGVPVGVFSALSALLVPFLSEKCKLAFVGDLPGSADLTSRLDLVRLFELHGKENLLRGLFFALIQRGLNHLAHLLLWLKDDELDLSFSVHVRLGAVELDRVD
jgi:hypothetical protein